MVSKSGKGLKEFSSLGGLSASMLGSEWSQKIDRRSESNGERPRTGTGVIHIGPVVWNRGVRVSAFSEV